ncbi:tudor domain-containing protein 1 isoform X2 [Hemicordylus capensis]|uniref:tudor domain-containing protein 1 isoform X2 n=1 Tax=Hemicordylus capensis TaxID=884348 RepID=UPI0023048252|nr:tudor domain-containing protein 1 isoform X2 [Hemicordylus capensis]
MAQRSHIRNKELKTSNVSLRSPYTSPNVKSFLPEDKALSKNFLMCDQTKLFFANRDNGSGESNRGSCNRKMVVSDMNGGDATGTPETVNISCNLLSSLAKETNPVLGSALISAKEKRLQGSPENVLSVGCEAQLHNRLSLLNQPTCRFCGLFGSLRCMQCKQVYYCSLECQKKDWQMHSIVCRPVKQNTDKVENNAKLLDEIKKKDNLQSANANKAEEKGKKTMFSDLNTLGLKKNTKLEGTVTDFINPCEFYIQVNSPEVLSNLNKLSVKLKYHYGVSEDEYIPVKGEVCVAKYSVDQTWYRVLIKEVDVPKKRAEVLYIDYGNRESAQLHRIARLHKDIAHFPPCAIKCCVANVLPAKEEWDANCSSTIAPLLVGKYCSLTILDVLMGETTSFTVDVVLPGSGKHLHEILLEMGHGLNAKDMNGRKENSATGSTMGKISSPLKTTEDKGLVHSSCLTPKVISLSIGHTFLGMVAHIQTPGDFFCQQMENGCKLSELQVSLREYCYKITTNPDFCPAVGDMCCAQFTDDHWYRASVLSYVSERTVRVGYVDYGNFEVLQLSRLRPIISKLLELPVQAIKCTLAGVKPESGTWSIEATSIMKQLMQNKVVIIEVVDKKENTFVVELTDGSETPIRNMSKYLLESGYAVEEAAGALAVLETKVGTLQEMCDQTLEKAWSWVTLAPKQVVNVVVCVLYNPSEFYCHLLNSDDLNALKYLNTCLVDYCQKTAPSISKVAKEKPCCAYFSGDGRWYRALVKEATSSGTFKVQFVDYGNIEEVTLDKLRQISSTFLKLPFQAIRCSLSGVRPINKEWTAEAAAMVQMITAGKKLQARVVSLTTNGAEVELADYSFGSPKMISEILINEHLASKREVLSKQDLLPGKLATSDSQEVFTHVQWRTAEFPVNEMLAVRVIEVINPGLFYVVPVKVKVDQQKLCKLMIELADYCESQNEHLFKPKVGEACCARFSGDDHWYRAIVLEISVSEVKVAYADYGNVETLQFSRLQPITASFLELPFQIFKCSLAGIMELDGQWHESATVKLKNLLLNERVVITVRGISESIHAVTVIRNCGSRILDVADQLLGKNVTKYNSGNQCAKKTECCCTEFRKQVAKHEEIIYFLLKGHIGEDTFPEIKPFEG